MQKEHYSLDMILIEQNKTELLSLLKMLISIPSVNTGENQQGIPEQAIAEFVGGYLKDIGMEVEWLRMPNGRPNVLGRWPGSKNKKVLILTAHMDTVNVEGMTSDPFAGKMHGGRIYGRGACDTKGSLAVYLWVLRAIADHRDMLDMDVQFLATCDEENGCVGSTWLTENNLIKADRVIVGEPTNCEIAIAHRGSIVLEFYTTGVSAHASVPERGDNAVYQMSDLINCLRKEWLAKIAQGAHPVLGNACASVTMIQGGLRYNIIPDQCKIVVDMRILPGQEPEAILQELEGILCPLRQTDKVNYRICCQSHQPALYTDPEIPFVKKLLQAGREVTGKAEPVGVPYFADSSQFARLGAECVLLGPGDIAQAHGACEFLELEQLYQSAEILLRFFT
ncbi:MAG: M20 family metallopeptidase [Phycisphaerae bacterium]